MRSVACVCGFVFSFSLILSSCGSAPQGSGKTGSDAAVPAVPAAAAPAPKPVADRTSALPKEGLQSSKVVPDHILDVPKMPGGSLGEYEVKGRKFQMFVIDADTNQGAAFLLLDMKAALKDTEYLAHMGGYFGMKGDVPVYTFAKLHYLAGVVGLPKGTADPLARVLASRLR
jgi:hypothetical protein